MEEKSLMKIPPEILDMIFKRVPLQDKKNLRLVSKEIRDIVDGQTRYTVILNNDTCVAVGKFSPPNTSTLVVETFNQPMRSTSTTRSILANMMVDELVLVGRSKYIQEREKPNIAHYPYVALEAMDACYVDRRVEHWVSLESLSSGITAVNLNYIVRFTNETITTLVISSDIFVEYDRMPILSPTPFPNLKALEFTVVHLENSVSKDRVNTAINKIFGCQFPCLKTLALRTNCPCSEVSLLQWIDFYRCAVAHKNTLLELKVHHHFYFNLDDFMNINPSFTTDIRQLMHDLASLQLKRLNLSVFNGAHIYLQNKRIYENSFEIQLLKSQTQLEVLKINFEDLYVEGLFACFPTNEHLKACSIRLGESRSETEEVNLNFLSQSENLKLLKIVCEQDQYPESPWIISGLSNLPCLIEKLVLTADLTINDAFWIQTHLTKLRHIQYYGGIRRSQTNAQLEPAVVEVNNHAHFVDCVNQLPELETFQLGISSDKIISTLDKLKTKVRFEIQESCKYNQYHNDADYQ